MSAASSIWLEPDDDMYDAPLTDPRLRAWLLSCGINPAKCIDRRDSDNWRWFDADTLAPRSED